MDRLFDLLQRKKGKKPIGSYEIDWGHPLTKALTDAIFMGNGKSVNAVKNNSLGSGTLNGGIISDKDGLLFDEIDDYINFGIQSFAHDFTIYLNLKYTDTSGSYYQYILNYGDSFDNNTFSIVFQEDNSGINGSKIDIRCQGANYSSVDFNTIQCFCVSYNHSEEVITLTSAHSQDVFNIGGDIGSNLPLRIGGRFDEANDRWFGGLIRSFYMYNEVHTTERARSILRDPYQFLKPSISLQDTIATLFQEETPPPIYLPPSIFINSNTVIKQGF